MSQFIIPDSALEKLICASCKCYLSIGPVLVTDSEENICGRCAELINKRNDHKISLRQFAYEHLAESGFFKCSNHYEGCDELLLFNHVTDHEQKCKFKTHKCPNIFVDDRVCDWNGTAYELIQHYKAMHRGSFIENNTIFIDTKSDSQKNYLLLQNELVFVVQLKCSITEQKFWIGLVSIGLDEFATKMHAQIHLIQNDCSYTFKNVPCIKNDTFYFIMVKNNCKEIKYSHIKELKDPLCCKIEVCVPEEVTKHLKTEIELQDKELRLKKLGETLEIEQKKLQLMSDRLEQKKIDLDEKEKEVENITRILDERSKNIKDTQVYIHGKLKYINKNETQQERLHKRLEKKSAELSEKERQLNLRESIVKELERQIQQGECVHCEKHQQIMKNHKIQLEILKCNSCQLYMVPPILECLNGHINCFDCIGYDPKCKICSVEEFDYWKVYEMPIIFDKIALPCRWEKCHQIVTSASIREHEQSCSWRVYRCVYYLCSWRGILKDFIKHWDEKHSDKSLHIANEWLTPSCEIEWVRFNLVAYREIWSCVISPSYNLGRIINIDYYGPTRFIERYQFEVSVEADSDSGVVNVYEITRSVHYADYCRHSVIVPTNLGDNIIIRIIKN